MNMEVITKEDLQIFRLQLINDLKELFFSKQSPAKEWLKSSEVRKFLKISSGTLQNLRIAGKLHPAKIGGIYYYQYDELERLLEKGK